MYKIRIAKTPYTQRGAPVYAATLIGGSLVIDHVHDTDPAEAARRMQAYCRAQGIEFTIEDTLKEAQ